MLGTLDGLECWRMEDSDDIVVWDRMWDRSVTESLTGSMLMRGSNVPAPYYLTISSNTGHVSWYAKVSCRCDRPIQLTMRRENGQFTCLPRTRKARQ